MNKMDFTYLGFNLRHFRQLRGFTQHELAQLAGATLRQTEISSYERGLRPSDSHDIVVLADALDVSVESLVRRPRFITRVDAVRPSVFRSPQETEAGQELQMAGQES